MTRYPMNQAAAIKASRDAAFAYSWAHAFWPAAQEKFRLAKPLTKQSSDEFLEARRVMFQLRDMCDICDAEVVSYLD